MSGVTREMGHASARSEGVAIAGIPEETIRKWQRSVDLLTRLLQAASVVVVSSPAAGSKILVASQSSGSAHAAGKTPVPALESFCSHVLRCGSETSVEDARQDARWAGSGAAAEGWVSLLGFPLFGMDNEAFGVLAVLDRQSREHPEPHRELLRQYRETFEQDVRRLAERASTERPTRHEQGDQRLISAILDTADLLVVVLDARGRIVRFNHACERHTGYSAQEVRGKCPWDVLMAPEDANAVRRVFDDLRSGSFPSYYENDWVAKDGRRRLIAWTNTTIVDEHGDVEYVLGTGIDLTERRRAEEERSRLERLLLQSQKIEALGQLAGGVAHGFQNWLTVILCATEKLSMALGDDPANRDVLGAIEHAGRQAAGVTRSLLAFSRDVPVGREPICLGSAVDEWTSVLRRALPASVELIVDTQPEPPIWIRGDPTQLQQLLLNLVLNARDAMPDGGTLRIGVRRAQQEDLQDCAEPKPPPAAGEYACVTVTDSGVGITPERRDYVFEPFFTTKPSERGSGLGLSIVHNVVKQHGGFICLSSDVGKGTAFRILLPMMADGTPASRELVNTSVARGHDEAVLLMMPDAHSRGLTAFSLGAMGYHVRCAADPEAAMSQALHEVPRAVVVDADLMAGGTAEWLRRILASSPSAPVVVIATDRNAGDVPDLPGGRVAVLEKPFQTAQLGKILGDMLFATHRR